MPRGQSFYPFIYTLKIYYSEQQKVPHRTKKKKKKKKSIYLVNCTLVETLLPKLQKYRKGFFFFN